ATAARVTNLRLRQRGDEARVSRLDRCLSLDLVHEGDDCFGRVLDPREQVHVERRSAELAVAALEEIPAATHEPGLREDALEVDAQPDRARGEPEPPAAVDDDQRPPVAG